ncbi:hypothetical protein GSI_00972 [Ganoderma sinense ZZ0214-1]|uniref:Uncharacterized protein n=1 Tax=Ganoderma sinense ZZ0214-1 TaxID=1077348 RepID=A0A2G8SU24_9APHY|nr:hypothetical protein GSI_00972 [Ganoderma sinense ZZ0214-1]
MSSEQDWDDLLRNHPIFSLPKGGARSAGRVEAALNLSLSSLPDFVDLDPAEDKPTPCGRRQAIVVKDADLIAAVGSEIRITSLGDSKGARNTSQKTYKILHTPSVQFEIHQIALNPNGRLLAIAGAFQVAVIVLPRTGYNKLVTATVECKEYDISEDADEPQQTLSFFPEKKKGSSFLADDGGEREAISFALGKGRADWGPLTVYAVMRSGDIYAISPYMPKNASIPSSYVHALECYVSAKLEFLSTSTTGKSSSSDSLTTLYDYQRKYVNALLKQLPPGTAWPATARLVSMHPPTTIKNPCARQGPFLLQPAPRNLEASEGGDATDIVYMSFGDDAAEESEGETERLGLILVAFQDGKVDVYLDVEKVEARWENKQHPSTDLPMLAVYESIDLGIVSSLKKSSSNVGQSLLDLIQGNHPSFLLDPIHDDNLYVYHAFGAHVLNVGALLKSLASVLRDSNESEANSSSGMEVGLETVKSTDVQPVLLTFSTEHKSSTPVVGVAIPNDVYLTYSIFVLTSSMRMSVFPLNLRSETSLVSESPPAHSAKPSATKPPQASGSLFKGSQSSPSLFGSPAPPTKLASSTASGSVSVPALALPAPPDTPPAYVSLLSSQPWKTPDVIARPSGLPSIPRLSLPNGSALIDDHVEPETLRFLATTVEKLSAQIHDIQLTHGAAEARTALQEQEFKRQREACAKMLATVKALGGPRQRAAQDRIALARETQKALVEGLERVLQGLMVKASPELSESESRWFEELRRMKAEVVGAGKYDDQALLARTKLLRREVDRLLPHLKEMKEKEMARRENRETLGLSQAFELGKRSTEERARISRMETEIVKLAQRMDISIGRPPTQQQASPKGDAKGDGPF